ncbi:MAG: phytase [Anaerolineae bacterium]
MKYGVLLLTVILLIAQPVFSQDVPTIPAVLETESVPGSGATVPVIWIHPNDPALSLVIASDDNAGIAVYDLNGNMLQFVAEPTGISGLDLRYNFLINGQPTAILSAVFKDMSQFAIYSIDAASRTLQRLQVFDAPTALRNTCLYRSPVSGDYFVFVSSEDGDFGQYLLSSDNGTLNITLMRAFSLDTSIGECVADDEFGNLFVAEEPVAIWRYSAEPDADSSRTLVDAVDEANREFEGLALYYAANGGGYLLASTLSGFNIYERSSGTYLASFQIPRTDAADAVEDPNGIDVVNFPLNDTFAEGLFVTADEINTEPDVDNNFKFVAWSAVASQFNLPVDTTFDPRAERQSQIASIAPTDETDPVVNYGDAADRHRHLDTSH